MMRLVVTRLRCSARGDEEVETAMHGPAWRSS